MKNKALVVGALGVVVRGLINYLTRLDEWDTVALSRRPVDDEFNVPSVSIDLLDIDECRRKLPALTDVTHIFYVAYAPRPTHAEEVEPNLRMLQNLMDGLDRAAPTLKHVSLMQGTKAYGAHLGPYKTPARETDPRIIAPLFYFPQQDFLTALASKKSWTWSIMRPRCIGGFSVGSPMNMTPPLVFYPPISNDPTLPPSSPVPPARSQ